mgnify:CR=1 FL=1
MTHGYHRRRGLSQVLWFSTMIIVLVFFVPQNLAAQVRKSSSNSSPNYPAFENTAPGVGYTGSEVCAKCHRDIYDRFMKTDMGRSMALPSDPTQLTRIPEPITVHDQKLDRYFSIFREGSNLYQSEFQLGPDGKDIFRNVQQIAYVIGSGRNGLGYIIRTGHYLFEAPLSYYHNSGIWELSPGYEFADYGFSRPIAARCIFCHSGRPRPVMDRDGLFQDPPFRELAIGCETCHGPGQLHVQQREKAELISGRIDYSIVNPAKISNWLADNICMNCHQGGDTRVLQPGKKYADFRPGTPLDNTVAVFQVPLTRATLPQSPLLQHYELMILSKCYRESAGKLSCATCHDPHQQPSPSEAPAFYRQKCLTCHTENSCTLPLQTRLAKSTPDNCAGCHMPKRPVRTISHSVLTDHRIIAKEGEPFPKSAFHQTTAALPGLYHIDAIPGRENRPVAPVVLFKAYGELMASHPEYQASYEKVLRQLAQENSNDPLVLSALARNKMKEGTPEALEEATGELTEAIKRGSALPSDFELLSNLLARAGHLNDSIDLLKRAIALNPYSARLYKVLALQYISKQQYTDALQVMRQELAIFPQDSFMRMLVNKAEGASAGP